MPALNQPSLKNIWTLTFKEFRSLFSDIALLIMIVVVFTVTIYMAAVGMNTEVRHAPVGVIDLDHTALTEQIQDALQEPYFREPVDITYEDVDEMLNKGELIFVLVFPPEFERDVLAGRKPEVQLLIDATTMTQAGVGEMYITQIFNEQVSDFLNQSDPPMMVKPVLNTMFNPNANSEWFTPVMEVCNTILLLALMLSGAAVIRERERGTIEHLLVMPVNTTEIVLSKILANGIVILCASMLSMTFMVQGVLGIPINGSLAVFAIGVALYLFSISSLGIMLATIAPTMPQFALLMLPVLVILQLLSGSFAPRSNMPEMVQLLSEYWPSTQFIKFAQDVLIRNAGIETIWPQLVAMIVIGILFLLFALRRFKSMLERLG